MACTFAAVVVGGYLASWRWTGFRHNTAWDWLRLLLLPPLIPTVVVPALKPLAMSGVTVLRDADTGSGEMESEHDGAVNEDTLSVESSAAS